MGWAIKPSQVPGSVCVCVCVCVCVHARAHALVSAPYVGSPALLMFKGYLPQEGLRGPRSTRSQSRTLIVTSIFVTCLPF